MRALPVCLGLFGLPEALNRLPLIWTFFGAGLLLGVGLCLVPALWAARRWRAEADATSDYAHRLLESPAYYRQERAIIEQVCDCPEYGDYGRKSGQPPRRIVL